MLLKSLGSFFILLVMQWLVLPAVAGDVLPIAIVKADGSKVNFTAELASTPKELATGLMNRDSLDADKGMLFDFGSERPVKMWMKNTLIPLDMLFIDKKGKIVYIAENAKPLSLDFIEAEVPVRYVLEIGGGESKANGIAAGDKLKLAPR